MMYVGIITVAILGTLLHFMYEWSDHNKFVAIFAAVNESTWEHIKICMTPTILWSLYDGYIYGANSNYFIAKSLSLLLIILLIPFLFYTYTSFTKKAILWVDIICFYFTVTCSGLLFNYFVNLNPLPFIFSYLSCILLFIETCAYMFLTFNPPKNFIFKDPISHKYGISGHTEMHQNKDKH